MKILLLVLGLLVPFTAFTQITQIGQDIDGEAADNLCGRAVSMSADGQVVAVGSPHNDGFGLLVGHVRVFQNEGGVWTQIGDAIEGEAEFDTSGHVLSLSADGSIVAIGASQNAGNGSSSGHVRIFQNDGGIWTQIGDDIDGDEWDQAGSALGLSANGQIVAIGAPRNSTNNPESGRVRVYENVGGAWMQLGQDIFGEAAGDRSGRAISLSSDGTILAIASTNNADGGTNAGHVRVYQFANGTWAQLGQDLDGEAETYSGWSVDLNAEGNILAIGAVGSSENGPQCGHVRLYEYSDPLWTQIGADVVGVAENDVSGYSVSLNDSGNVLAIGAIEQFEGGFNPGYVRIFMNFGGTWTQRGETIFGESTGDLFGTSISLNADGGVVAIGAPYHDGSDFDSGTVQVFDVSSVLGLETPSVLDFTLYPLPTAGILHVKSESEIIQISIYNLLGQLVASNNNQTSIAISLLGQGVYFCEIMDEKGRRARRKIIKG